jgi:CubicO group peptidase (beta-lactamase class C family)
VRLRILILSSVLLSSLLIACGGPAPPDERVAGKGKLPEEQRGEGEQREGPPTNPSGGDPTAPAFDTKEIDAFVDGKLKATPGIPGISIALVKGGKVVAARAHGLADREANQPMKPETILEVASISKTITGVAMMQLVGEGKIGLDTDLSMYLGRTLRNPRFTSTAITPKMLATHTSSIVGNDEALDALFVNDADSTLPLEALPRQFLEQGGQYYSTQSFATTAPGTTWRYCNLCVGIVGHLVEKVSGTTLTARTKEKIFTPLGMTSTAWMLAETDKSRLVTPYSINPRTGQAERTPHFGLPDWPAGSLKMTATDLARFAAELSTGGAKLLPKTALDSMLKVHFTAGTRNPDQGLSFMRWSVGGKDVWGHDGALPGIASVFSFLPNEGLAVVVLANADTEVAEPTLLSIHEKAYAELAK